MSTEEEFTLHELVQLSLGSSEFGQINITLLHTVVNLALKKLGCENEKITITGLAAENLKELLKKSISPTLVFEEQNFQTPLDDLDAKIAQLEEKVTFLEQQFEHHLGEEKKADIFCTETEENDKIISTLLRNDWFWHQYKESINNIFTCRLNRIEININNLDHLMNQFETKFTQAFDKLVTIDALETKYFDLHDEMLNYRSDFKKSLNEIQYLLDQKVDNCDIPPTKKRIRDIIEHSAECARKVIEMKTKPRALLSFAEIDSDGKWMNMNANQGLPSTSRFGCDCEKDTTAKQSLSNRTNTICGCTDSREEKVPLVERLRAVNLESTYRLTWTGITTETYSAIKD